MRKEFESIEWDKNNNRVVIAKQEVVEIDKAKNLDDVKQMLRKRLQDQVRQIKRLKAEALKTKELLLRLEGRAESIDSAPNAQR